MQHRHVLIPSRGKTLGSKIFHRKNFCTLFNLRRYQFLTACIFLRVGNCLVFLVWGIFFGFPVLTIFHAICSILELETAISTVCATVLSSNLSFSIVFSTVFATVCSMFCPFSMLFAAFLSWNLHFHRMCNILQLHSSQYLQDFGAEG